MGQKNILTTQKSFREKVPGSILNLDQASCLPEVMPFLKLMICILIIKTVCLLTLISSNSIYWAQKLLPIIKLKLK
jgi:hypothetical protein